MILDVRAVPPFYKNGFVVACERTREGVLIDPGDEVEHLVAVVRDHEVDVRHILLTHAHVDHITGVAAAKDIFGVPVYLHRDDMFLYEQVVAHGAMFGMTVSPQPTPDAFYDGSTIRFGDYEVRVHRTPGHCPGGVCLQIGPAGTPGQHLFVGDTLFARSIGRTDLPGGDYAVLMRSITQVLFPLGDDAVVHPGHGPDTTIRAERTGNPFVLDYLAKTREGCGQDI
jgi:glyoxylase-like metal-dependent hydrolase (beta-lactamase superfamily II)